MTVGRRTSKYASMRPMMVVAAAAVPVLAACVRPLTENATPAGTPTPAAPTPVSSATQWHEPPSYSFVLDSRCGERLLIGRIRVTVGHGAVTEAIGLDEPGTAAVQRGGRDIVPTLGRLLEQVDTARHQGADVAQTDPDPADGHPIRVIIDPSAHSVDDEVCYTISEYTTTTG